MTRSPAKKPAASAKARPKAAKAAVDPVAAKPPETEGADPDATELRKKELVERIAEKADVKRKLAREVLEVVLAEIGDALSRGESLNLPPLGKAKVNRQKEQGAGEVIVLKLRRGGRSGTPVAQEDLAEPKD